MPCTAATTNNVDMGTRRQKKKKKKVAVNEEISPNEEEEESTSSRVAPARIQFALPPSCQSQLKAFSSSSSSFASSFGAFIFFNCRCFVYNHVTHVPGLLVIVSSITPIHTHW